MDKRSIYRKKFEEKAGRGLALLIIIGIVILVWKG